MQLPATRRRGWPDIAVSVLAAVGTILLVDAGLAYVLGPRPRIMQVEDGLRGLAETNPDILVLGSSHARSFLALADSLARSSNGEIRVQVVPEEGGTFQAFDWVLRERIRPIIDARSADGTYLKHRLRRALLVTTYWDMCPESRTNYRANLAARAWTWQHFMDDLRAHGLTDINRNYLRRVLGDAVPGSWLYHDRGSASILGALKLRALGGDALARTREEARARRIELRRREVELEGRTCRDPEARAALESTLSYLRRRVGAVDLVLFPLAPETVSPVSARTTLAAYRAYADTLARRFGVRVRDVSLEHPFRGTDFETDMDHMTPATNERFAAWAQAGPFDDLRLTQAAPHSMMAGQ